MVIITFLLDYIELIRRGGAKIQATLSLLFEMAALKLPHTAQEVLPFAILFGTMLAFWRLTRNNELVVARAAGVSVWQFLTPAVLVALLIGIVAVTIFNPIASFTEAAYEKLEGRVLRQGSDQLSLSNAGLWLRQSDQAGNQIIIHAGKIASQQLVLDPVTLFFFNDSTQFTSRIDAQTARARERRLGDRERHPLGARRAAPAFRRDAPGDHPDAAQDRGELRLAGHDVVLGSCPGLSSCSSSRAFRRSATACISTCCSPARFCCARWFWWRRPSACACSGAAARR